jgi:TRAP-type C4-dicarboxylate transport system permease small subunit
MRNAPRIFPTRLERGARRVYRAATLFYLLLFVALLWPVYPRFSGIEPRVLGLPFSMVYVIGGVLLSFAVLWALFTWENRRAGSPDSPEPDVDRQAVSGGAPAQPSGSAD